MLDKKDIIQVAVAIKPHLQKFMDEADAHAMDQDLKDLLTEVSSGKDVEDLILARLTTQKDIRKWLQNSFQENSEEQKALSKTAQESTGTQPVFQGLAGDPHPIRAPKYICPYSDCGFEFFLNKTGMSVPNCLIHHVLLVRADEQETRC